MNSVRETFSESVCRLFSKTSISAWIEFFFGIITCSLDCRRNGIRSIFLVNLRNIFFNFTASKLSLKYDPRRSGPVYRRVTYRCKKFWWPLLMTLNCELLSVGSLLCYLLNMPIIHVAIFRLKTASVILNIVIEMICTAVQLSYYSSLSFLISSLLLLLFRFSLLIPQ